MAWRVSAKGVPGSLPYGSALKARSQPWEDSRLLRLDLHRGGLVREWTDQTCSTSLSAGKNATLTTGVLTGLRTL